MFNKFILLIILNLPSAAFAGFPTIQNLRSQIGVESISAQVADDGYSMLEIGSWLSQPSNQLLLPSADYKHNNDIIIFHTRSHFLVDKAVGSFSKDTFYNLKFFESVNPSNIKDVNYSFQGLSYTAAKQELGSKHVQIKEGVKGNCAGICIKSTINFHPSWQSAIWLAKKLSALKEESTGFLEVSSETVFMKNSELNGQTKSMLSDIVRGPTAPSFMLHQAGYKANQMIKFSTSLIVGYEYQGKTLIVVDMVLGIKKDIDNKIRSNKLASNTIKMIFGKDPEQIVANVLLGREPGVNVADGIGKGIPGYTKDLTLNLKSYLEKK